MNDGNETGKPAEMPRAMYVGFWKRVLATIVDMLILMVVIVPLLLAIYGLSYLERSQGGFAGPLDFVIQVVLPAIAVILFWKFRGATPGKMLISAKIVDAETGQAPSTKQLIGRYFAYIVSTLPLCIGFLWVAFDARKQSWHDKLAGTLVVYDKANP